MTNWPCPYLKGDVELTEERERHIAIRHPDLLPEHKERMAETLADPDEIRHSRCFGAARLFSRRFEDVKGGKFVVVVVVSENQRDRHWIITAYLARKLAKGEVEWTKN